MRLCATQPRLGDFLEMAYLVDWNFQILPPLVGDVSNVSLSLDAMQNSFAHFGVRKFLLLAPYDPKFPLSLHLLARSTYCKNLKKALPKPLILQSASRTTLREGLSGNDGLEHLCHKQSGFLPIDLPISPYEDWMDAELNRLLYRRHQKLLFLSFERALILYPEEIIDKLLRISGAAYEFGYRSLSDPRVVHTVKRLLDAKKPVLLGTGLDRPDRYRSDDLFCDLEAAKPAFPKPYWDALLKSSRRFGIE